MKRNSSEPTIRQTDVSIHRPSTHPLESFERAMLRQRVGPFSSRICPCPPSADEDTSGFPNKLVAQSSALSTLEPFVDATRASEFLSLRHRHLLELARKGAIPSHPLGNGRRRVWRFRLSELAHSMSNKMVAFWRSSSALHQVRTRRPRGRGRSEVPHNRGTLPSNPEQSLNPSLGQNRGVGHSAAGRQTMVEGK